MFFSCVLFFGLPAEAWRRLVKIKIRFPGKGVFKFGVVDNKIQKVETERV